MNDDLIFLIRKVQSGSEAEFRVLTEQYEPLIDSMASRYAAMAGIGKNDGAFADFRQECVMALYRAVLSYRLDQDQVTFGLYAKVCIRNRLLSHLRHLRRQKRSEARSAAAARELRSRAPLRDAFGFLSTDEELSAIRRRAASVLSDYELTVFDQYRSGKSPKEIAHTVGRSVKSVNNALCRMKAKLKGLLRQEHDI